MERIGFGTRLGAEILNIIIDLVLGVILGIAGGGFFGAFLGQGNPYTAGIGLFLGAALGISVAVALVSLLNNLLEAFIGASLGKMALGIKIKSADGMPAAMSKLWLRFIIKNISLFCLIGSVVFHQAIVSKVGGILGLIVVIGFFFTLGVSRQAFHDMIAGTAVYKR